MVLAKKFIKKVIELQNPLLQMSQDLSILLLQNTGIISLQKVLH